jgi:hypothetical protein
LPKQRRIIEARYEAAVYGMRLCWSADFNMDGNTICFEADQRALRITYQEQASRE